MHGLIFVTWEKYLVDRFGVSLLREYRNSIGETPSNSPLATRVYDDATLLAGVGAAHTLTGVPVDTLLREYGRYFIENGLTSHLCSYLLSQVHSGRDLLLTMRDAHAQMRRTPDAITPPLFAYEALSTTNPNMLALIYNSPRKLCAVLLGAIEGAAERYGERVQIFERTCMNRGASECRFEIRFFTTTGPLYNQTPQQLARQATKQQVDNLLLVSLPDRDGMTLTEIQRMLRARYANVDQNILRPKIVLDSLHHLQHAGLVSSTANQPGDDFNNRRYWRAPTSGQ